MNDTSHLLTSFTWVVFRLQEKEKYFIDENFDDSMNMRLYYEYIQCITSIWAIVLNLSYNLLEAEHLLWHKKWYNSWVPK